MHDFVYLLFPDSKLLLQNLEGVQTGVTTKSKVDDEGVRHATDKARLEEINQLKELLESARTATQNITEHYEAAKQEATVTSQQVKDLMHTIQTLQHEKAEVKSRTLRSSFS